MRNVNTNAWFCKEVIRDDQDRVTGYTGILSGIAGTQDNDGNIRISMGIVFSIFAMETTTELDSDYRFGHEYELCLRLTHLESDRSQDLKVLSLPRSSTGMYRQEKKMIEQNEVLILDNHKLEAGIGKYQLKILIREKGAINWIVQSVHSLVVF